MAKRVRTQQQRERDNYLRQIRAIRKEYPDIPRPPNNEHEQRIAHLLAEHKIVLTRMGEPISNTAWQVMKANIRMGSEARRRFLYAHGQTVAKMHRGTTRYKFNPLGFMSNKRRPLTAKAFGIRLRQSRTYRNFNGSSYSRGQQENFAQMMDSANLDTIGEKVRNMDHFAFVRDILFNKEAWANARALYPESNPANKHNGDDVNLESAEDYFEDLTNEEAEDASEEFPEGVPSHRASGKATPLKTREQREHVPKHRA